MGELANKAVSVAVGPKESALLALIREKKYSRIEIEMKDGEIDCIHVSEEISPSGANIEEIINGNAHQTVTIAKHGGELARIKRRIPIKL